MLLIALYVVCLVICIAAVSIFLVDEIDTWRKGESVYRPYGKFPRKR